MNKKNLLAYAAVTTAMILWALSFIWYKEAFENKFSPISVIFLRLTIAVILFLIVTSTIFKRQKVARKHYKLFFILAFFEPFLYFMAEAHGLKYVSATVASVIIALIPLLTPFAAYLFLKQKLKPSHLIGLIISFVGVGMVVFAGSSDVSANSLGISLMFVAAISVLGYSITLVKLLENYNTVTIMLYQNIIAWFLFLPFFLLFDIETVKNIPFTFESYYPILKLGVFASVVAFTLFVFSLNHISITIANMFTYLIPALTALFAFVILDENIYLQSVIGIFVVICGLIIPHIYTSIQKKRSS